MSLFARSTNWTGNKWWTEALEWEGKEGFNAEELAPWYASQEAKEAGAKQAGEFRQYGNLAFAIVDASGHFVPYDHPVESLAMFNSWIHNGNFSSLA
ncbi:BZ3500_MvSof-1268-A1-R1_Chr6-2g08515 [Microbotryum saponariae]|uniref:BZ3500_MvSof-1268-A1-R1_Chr6-2g08515 protein n=1 Tax=Microbotryum saponariae TaxID=289078 RepID=A0A2X0MMX1_9BASI|nr:BZ3500_MvSof-1268-A1-R1_Chr6-2g08515 [Microbotryum saponariae]SDA07792.1 BZ3501_MvSof-1269-A2-R1_Chr6-1g08229 [Microbotryum saponariae]